MSGRAADFTTEREPIHHATRLGYHTPSTCGKTDQPKPSSVDWWYVTCPRCLALAKPNVHARKTPTAIALCGAARGEGGSTRKRSEVTCRPCGYEIEARR